MKAANGGGKGDACTGAYEIISELKGWVEMALNRLTNEKDMWVALAHCHGTVGL